MRGLSLLIEAGSTGNLERYPSLSVIVPARNEENAIKESVETMLAQSYPGELEVIVIDDRSTDGTGRILDSLQSAYPDRLKFIRVKDLPEGWLGKNHALYLGAKSAQGEWLLFTDADVCFSPNCFEYAMNYASSKGLHHLTLPPEILSRSLLLRAFVAAFTMIFTVAQRPWRARDPRSGKAVGVGSFNLLSRDVYERIGTHRAIAMRPDDDMKLAKLVKKHGFKQDVAYGSGLVSVEWHESLKGAVHGLGKSMFPGMDYRGTRRSLVPHFFSSPTYSHISASSFRAGRRGASPPRACCLPARCTWFTPGIRSREHPCGTQLSTRLACASFSTPCSTRSSRRSQTMGSNGVELTTPSRT
jgi:glycosyltransferase involved in cell wall biosynthesis